MKKSAIVIVIFIFGAAAAAVYLSFELPTKYEIVSLSKISGLSDETLASNGVYYRISEKVIFRPFDDAHPYTFKITPFDRALFPEGPAVISGTAADLNRIAHEITFTSTYDKKRLAVDFGKGGVESIVDMIMAPVKIIAHPIKFVESVGTLGVAVYRELKDIVSGHASLSQIEASVREFARWYWYELCVKRARAYNLDYSALVYASSKRAVENDAEAFLAGKTTADVAAAFIIFSRLGEVTRAARIAAAARTIECIGPAAESLGIVRFGAGAVAEYTEMVSDHACGIWIVVRTKLTEVLGNTLKLPKTEEVEEATSGAEAVRNYGEAEHTGEMAKARPEEGTEVQKPPLQPSQELAQNLEKAGKPKPPGNYDAHHIVPYGAGNGNAVEARRILEKLGIDINSADNGVWLPAEDGVGPGAIHTRIHTNKYYEEVNRLLRQCKSREEAQEVLQNIAEQLSKNTFPYK